MAEAEEPRPWVGQDSRARNEHEHEHEHEHGRAAPEGPRWRPGGDGERLLQRRLGTADRAERFYDEQVLDHLNERMREFVQRQEMFFLATAGASGECDSTFRAGPAGFLQVLGERALAYPEYRGNGVHASLGNIEENPHLGIMLIDFTRARIGLHVNGRAALVGDEEMRARYPHLPEDPVPGRRAQLWVHVEVDEAYIHCAKHIPQLQKAPKRTARDWGTDDYKRKGGDFFGTARDARERAVAEAGGGPREHSGPAGAARSAEPVEQGADAPSAAGTSASGTSGTPAEPAAPTASSDASASPASPASSASSFFSSASFSSSPSRASSPYDELPGFAKEEAHRPEPSTAADAAPGTSKVMEAPDAFGRRRRSGGGSYSSPGSSSSSSSYSSSSSRSSSSSSSSGPDMTPSVPEQRRAPEWQWPDTKPPSQPPLSALNSYEQTGPTAMDGASGALAARGAQSSSASHGSLAAGEDPHAWREAAERALAEAQRRGAESERSSFQGWFG